MSEEGTKLLLCRQCRAPKVDDRKYCSYCVGRDAVKCSPFRVRLAYKLLPAQWKQWFVFYSGYEKKYDELIPEHLREGDWITIAEANRPRPIGTTVMRGGEEE